MNWLSGFNFNYPWRVWRAFEDAHEKPDYGRALAATCRRADGRLDVGEYERWLDVLTERMYQWATA